MIGQIIGATCAFILFFFIVAAPLREETKTFRIFRALMWTGFFVLVAEFILAGFHWLFMLICEVLL
jgi:hypothetical protein